VQENDNNTTPNAVSANCLILFAKILKALSENVEGTEISV
jgi:hypothetical protein